MMPNRHWVEPYDISPTNICYCSSGRNFGECCGSLSSDRSPPVGFHVVPEFLTPSNCSALIELAEEQSREPLQIAVPDENNPGQLTTIPDRNRIAELFDIDNQRDAFDSLVRRACQNHAGILFGGVAEWFEQPYVLRYNEGGRFAVHADAEIYDREHGKFFRSSDRDISVLIYLNDDYSGGELEFTLLNFSYKPRQGDLVMFPPTHIFTHQSAVIQTGVKYTVVSWVALQGSLRMYPQQQCYVSL